MIKRENKWFADTHRVMNNIQKAVDNDHVYTRPDHGAFKVLVNAGIFNSEGYKRDQRIGGSSLQSIVKIQT